MLAPPLPSSTVAIDADPPVFRPFIANCAKPIDETDEGGGVGRTLARLTGSEAVE